MERRTRIVIIDQNPVRRAILEEGLREAGHDEIVHLSDTENLMQRVVAIDPDVIVIDLESPSRDVLEQMFQMSRAVPRPVAMFVDQSDTAMINAAIDAGVSAYVVDGLKKERVKPILDMCVSRFNAFARLREELEQAEVPARRPQGHRPRQGHPDEGHATSARRRPTPSCARRR